MFRVAALVLVAALGCKGEVLEQAPGQDAAAHDGPAAEATLFPDGNNTPPADLATSLTLKPTNPTVTVESGKVTPTVSFTAWLGAKQIVAKWQLDQGEFGDISAGGVFTPSGKAGGMVKVTATAGNLKVSTNLLITLKMEQNGTTKANGNPGPGGFGGVGGEGLGPKVSAAVKTLLDGSVTAAPSARLLYPYDKTVWPLGILAPLIQWSGVPGGGDGVVITLTGTFFSFKGYFARPAALAAGATFQRHPIPQDVWQAATRSAAGSKLVLRLVVAAGGKAHGPLTQTWIVARGALKGTVYYQSYGTNLVKNYSGAKSGGKFGGATLAIKGGSTDPTLVAGKNGGTSDCRVCHSVNAKGTRMVVQHGNQYSATSSYDLLKGYAETVYPASTVGKLGWIGMTPDGKLGLGNAAPIPGGANPVSSSQLYDMASGAQVAASGLSSFVTRAGFPMFSPDGKQVAFTFYSGPGDATIGSGDTNKLVVMDFDAATKAFSKPRLLYKGAANSRPGWPAFWPTGKALVFQRELAMNPSKEYFATRYGARGDLYWVDLTTGTSHPLELLNGKSYLPTGPNKHDKDHELAYEPTVSPIASGGYAWVVFVTRRMYGNVATIDPWSSDPREYDHTKAATCKKLWVAALDLNPKPGSDPSHPAFYLPAQELLAGNSRGFWVVDPCKPDGQPCQGGDECCNGYCSKNPATGKLVCGKFGSTCAKEYDKCTQSVDCCDYPKIVCVNGYCTRWQIN